MPTHHQVDAFLKRFQAVALKNLLFVPRGKNVQSIIDLGMSFACVKETILNLAYTDYVSGPSANNANPVQNIWVFGTRINGDEIYIKLVDDFSGGCAICISFHRALQPLQYPFKKGG